jgi:ribosome-binding factor A
VQRMDELLARARAADADVARVRVGAKPAGEADPYRDNGSAAPPASGAPDGLDAVAERPQGVGAPPAGGEVPPPACGGET